MIQSVRERPYLAVLSEDYVKCRQENEQNLAGTINYLFHLINVKIEEGQEQDRDLQTVVLMDFIRDKFGHLTTEEIKEAFKIYTSGGFGIEVYRMLDSIIVSNVLNKYLDYRAENLRVYDNKKQVLELPIITENGKKEIVKQGIIRVFNEFKESKSFGTNNTEYVFDELVSYGLIKLPSEHTPKINDYYKRYEDMAKLIVSAEVKKKTNRSDVSKLLQEIRQDRSKLVELKTKELVLEQYFLQMIKDDTSMEDIIKEK